MNWYTSDQHFGHKNIIQFCSRPFADIDEMNRALIDNWNAVVGPDDDVYVVGDFAFRTNRSPQSFLSQLAGRKHLVRGNHDNAETVKAPGWASVQDMALVQDGQDTVFLCHYAMRTWPKARRGAIHLFGHSHGNMEGTERSCDVGVDCWGYTPVRLVDIKRRLQTLRPADQVQVAEMPKPDRPRG